MKKILLALLMILAAINTAYAKEYESSYGFTINVPKHWLVLTPAELKENPDLFDFENSDFGNMDKNLLKQVINKIKSGNAEIYFNQKTADFAFTDNINIIKYVGRVPSDESEVKQQCSVLGAQLSQYFGRNIKIYDCKTTNINNKMFFMSEFDGAVEGTTSIQYQYQKSPSVSIIITSTSKNTTTDTIRKEFTAMMNSIKFK